jgi:aminoglycoside phosphotransferase (APT) family kinase protein
LLHREHDNMLVLRSQGFDAGRHLVPRPLAMSDAIDWVLLEEFVEGRNIHQIIREAIFFGGGLMEPSITVTAELLARFHRLQAPADLLPRKDAAAYYDKVVAQLRAGEVISAEVARRLEEIGGRWNASGILSEYEPLMIHGDATPEHFLYDDTAPRMHVIDLESLRLGDPAEDLGYLTGEIKHHFWTYTRDPWSSEAAIRRLYDAYAYTAGLSRNEAERLTERARYFMGCAELRIARNAWLPFEHRVELAAEAERCLRI